MSSNMSVISFWWLLLLISCCGIVAENEKEKLSSHINTKRSKQTNFDSWKYKGNKFSKGKVVKHRANSRKNVPATNDQIEAVKDHMPDLSEPPSAQGPVKGNQLCSGAPGTPSRPCSEENHFKMGQEGKANSDSIAKAGNRQSATHINQQTIPDRRKDQINAASQQQQQRQKYPQQVKSQGKDKLAEKKQEQVGTKTFSEGHNVQPPTPVEKPGEKVDDGKHQTDTNMKVSSLDEHQATKTDDLVLDQRNSRDFYDDPHSAENLQDHVDETTDILTDRENDPLVIIDSIVDESIKSGALPRPVDGALNVNIINVYVDVDQKHTGEQEQQQQKEQQTTEETKQAPKAETELKGQSEVKTQDAAVEVQTEQPPQELEKIPSFDEWKQKMLAEQAEQEKSKQLEAAVNTVANGNPTKSKSNKRMTNFAAITCGAKVLSTNTEARNPGSVLTENKDQYMIQPCKAKKWFVVELCEPVQVRNLEIANLELFSSLPESFVAHISDRFPTKEWKALGTFHAREERTVQSFSVGGEEMFAKYVKIEMLSHYGKEHYCPLSIIRVFGTTVVEDYEDVEQPEEPPADDEEDILSDAALQQQATAGESGNLFDSAKDTVLSIVKNVLNTEDKDGQKVAEELNKIVAKDGKLNSTLNSTSTNGTSEEQAKPCTPEPSAPDSPTSTKPAETPTEPSTPTGETVASPGDKLADTPVVTKVDSAHHESQDIMEELVTLIERPQTSFRKTLLNCQYCQISTQNVCYFDQASVCGYQKILSFIYPTSCVRKVKQKGLNVDYVSDTKTAPRASSSDVASEETTGVDKESDQQTSSEETSTTVRSERADIVPTPASPTSEQAENEQMDSTLKPSISQSLTSESEKQTIPKSTAFESKQVTTKFEEPVSSKEESNFNDCVAKGGTVIAGSGGGDTSCTMGPDVVEVRPSTTTQPIPEETKAEVIDDSLEKNVDSSKGHESVQMVDKAEKQLEDKQTGQVQSEQGSHQEEVKLEADAGGNGMKNIYAEEPSTDPSDLELDTLTLPDNLEEPIQKLSSKNKETAFMRLKNRIKELELNLNLSSRYLEELSKNYKRQMEDMYTSLNKTITKLTNTSKSAEARDLKQQEYIKKLETEVSSLTTELMEISDSISNIHKQVIERHLFLMCIEAVLFLALFSFCLGWRRQPYNLLPTKEASASAKDTTSSQTFKKENKIKLDKIPLHKEDKKRLRQLHKHRRRNSVDATPPRPKGSQTIVTPTRSVDDLAIRLSVSEDSITIIEPTIPVPYDSGLQNRQWDVVKQKKKKKKHQKKLSWGGDKSIYLTDCAKESSSEISVETLSTASSVSLSSDGSTDRAASGLIRPTSDQTLGTVRTKPIYCGIRRSLDLGPSNRSQNRRSSELTKHTSNKSPTIFNGTVSPTESGQCKTNEQENGFSKLKKSKSNGTITELHNSSSETSKPRGIKHWFPGIKNTVT